MLFKRVNKMELTKREKEVYELFNAYKKKHPEATNAETYKATGTNPATLHDARKKLGLVKNKNGGGRKPQKSKPAMQTLVVPETSSENFAVIVCNKSNLIEVLNAIR